jgi:deazaflavin-dependent oxidoreductase (nitroreductase family)
MTVTQLPVQSSRLADLMLRIGKAANPLTRHLAGRRFVTIWGLVSYRGRRSGTAYTLPIAIAAAPEAFVIPMPFPNAQWVKNVLATGECQVRWNGRDWHAVEPRIIPKAEGAAAFGPIPRLSLRVLPINSFLRLRRS